MPFLSALTERGRRVEAHRPWPRIVVDVATWRQAIVGLAAGEATLSGLWSDGEAVHMALIAEAKAEAAPAEAALAILAPPRPPPAARSRLLGSAATTLPPPRNNSS